MDEKKRIIFIVNPISGTHSKDVIIRLVGELIDRDKYDHTIKKTEYAGHASEIAAQAVREGTDAVVAIGGDGTINEIGRSLIHTSTSLGIIPCGSGNGLARHLHIPMDPKGAIHVINNGLRKTIDYGIIDGHPFFCTCGVGFDAFISLKFADSGRRGLLTYLENTLHESLNYQPETYEIENSEGTVHYKAFLIACANASQYGNNAYIAPQASLTDGMMDITILEPFTMLDVPSLSFQLFNRTLDQTEFMRKALEESDAKYKFVCMHEPAVPATERCWHYLKNSPERRPEFLKAIAENKAVFLCGHLHRYSVLRRNTEWGPVVQVMVNSVTDLKRQVTPSYELGLKDYGAGLVEWKPDYSPSNREWRLETLTAEAEYVDYYNMTNLPGYALISINGKTGNIMLRYYPAWSDEPYDEVNLTELLNGK